MKKTAILVAALAGMMFYACDNKGKNGQADATSDSVLAKMPKTEIEFAETKFDFGKIEQGTEAKHVYKFHNVGENPLTLTKVSPSCGCTVPKYSSEPVAPGAWGEIEVVFNTKKKEGMQSKSVTVEANTEPAINVLQFTAEVLVKNAVKE